MYPLEVIWLPCDVLPVSAGAGPSVRLGTMVMDFPAA